MKCGHARGSFGASRRVVTVACGGERCGELAWNVTLLLRWVLMFLVSVRVLAALLRVAVALWVERF